MCQSEFFRFSPSSVRGAKADIVKLLALKILSRRVATVSASVVGGCQGAECTNRRTQSPFVLSGCCQITLAPGLDQLNALIYTAATQALRLRPFPDEG
jgi:uncharacterized membrane protein YjjB (DUF3815 family)